MLVYMIVLFKHLKNQLKMLKNQMVIIFIVLK